LSVLTTCKDNVLSFLNCTSLATAQASRLAAILRAEYGDFWPETLRGLIVHSATWNHSMREGRAVKSLHMPEKLLLLRRYGYGVPDINRSRRSSQNSVCLVIQDALKPFRLSEKSGGVVYHEMNLHSLPWPADLLKEHGDLTVRLKVTLSYFIEPSPSGRLPQTKYAYMSHGLQFKLKRPLESDDAFMARVNGAMRDDNYVVTDSDDHWQLGPNTRNRGSIMSDIWEGSASELAEQGVIGIFPVSGWWKTRKFLNRYDSIARYALIVTIETDKQDLDIYTPIAQQVNIETPVAITIET
jgi:hypothetical protein